MSLRISRISASVRFPLSRLGAGAEKKDGAASEHEHDEMYEIVNTFETEDKKEE
jgi:hypothetical protein